MLPSSMPRLVGATVVLRDFVDGDAPAVVEAGRDPLIPLITTVPTGEEEAEVTAYLRRQQGRLAEGAGYSFAIAEATTGRAVGQIGLWTREVAAGRATIGYWVVPSARRRGYARAALSVLVDWAFAQDEVARLQLHVEPWNVGSLRTAKACGFRREGLLRSWERVGDERRDMAVYGLVREDLGGSSPSKG